MQKLYTKAAFARLCGVTKGAIQKAETRALAAAMVGTRVDFAHPAAIEYMQAQASRAGTATAAELDPLFNRVLKFFKARGYASRTALVDNFRIGPDRADKIIEQLRNAGYTFATSRPGAEAVAEKRKHDEEPLPDVGAIPEFIESYLDFTLRDIVAKFGTDYRFRDFLEAVSKIEAIQDRRIKNAERTGQLINRQLVKVGIIEPVDTALSKLLTDGSRTIATRAIAMHAAGRTTDEVEKFISDTVGSYIRPMKAKMKRALDHAGT